MSCFLLVGPGHTVLCLKVESGVFLKSLGPLFVPNAVCWKSFYTAVGGYPPPPQDEHAVCQTNLKPVVKSTFCRITIWLFNIAMEHGPFTDDFPSYKPPFIRDLPWLC